MVIIFGGKVNTWGGSETDYDGLTGDNDSLVIYVEMLTESGAKHL